MSKDTVEIYVDVIDRLEPDICPIDAGAFYASAAISLKRLADVAVETRDLLSDIHSRLLEIAVSVDPKNPGLE